MEYGFWVCLAVLFVAVVVLARNVQEQGAAIRRLRKKKQAGPESRPSPSVEAGVPGEVVAAIAAAVCYAYPGARISSVRYAAPKPRSAWQTAGLLELTKPF